MQDRELYRGYWEIEAPWFVERVKLKLESGEVHVWLDHHDMNHWRFPECSGECQLTIISRSGSGGTWITCQYQTIRLPSHRAECRRQERA
jgi:hypothetical protein